MLFYADEFPKARHHRQESELLSPRVRRCAPELAPVMDRLEADHAQGGQAIRALEHTLLAFKVMSEPRRAAFEQPVEHYIRLYRQHVATEAHEVLPAARHSLGPADWAELDAAFAAHRDPLTGHEVDAQYEPLFRRILSTLPAPLGLGAAR